MLKKLGVVTIGVTAGLAAAAPLASAEEAPGQAHASSNPTAIQAPAEQGALAGVLDKSNVDPSSNAQSLSGNSGYLNGHDLGL